MTQKRAVLALVFVFGGGVLIGHVGPASLSLAQTQANAPAAGPPGQAGEADRVAILEHIDGIFQACIRQDREAIRRTHTEDWTGFRGQSRGIMRGREAYMKDVENGLKSFPGIRYEILDSEVQVYGDIAVVYYVATYTGRAAVGGEERTNLLRTVDIYRREAGEWIQAGSNVSPLNPNAPALTRPGD